MTRTFVYTVELDDSGVEQTIRKIDRAIEALGKRASQSLQRGSGIGDALRQEEKEVQRASRGITRSFEQITNASQQSSRELVRDRRRVLTQLAALQESLSEESQSKGVGSKRAKDLRSEITLIRQVLAAQNTRIRIAKELEGVQRQQVKIAEQSLRRQARQERVLSQDRTKNSRQAARDFQRLIRLFPEQAQQIDGLIRRYGRFNAVLGRTGGEASDLDREFKKIISSNKTLNSEAQRLTGQFGNLTIGLNRFQQSVPRGGLSNILKGAVVAITLGSIVSALRGVTRETIRLTTEFVKLSTQTASQFEGIRTSIQAVFGELQTGSAVFDTIRKDSRALGADLTQTARRVLPFVSSLEEAREVSLLITDLARLDPDQGTAGALRSINDALVGQFRSLRESFEIPVGNLRELQEELGPVQGLLTGVRQNLDAVGVSTESLGGTFEVALARGVETFRDLRAEFGQPIVDVLNAELREFFEFFDENEQDVRGFFRATGSFVAEFVQKISDAGQNIAEQVDFDELIETVAQVSTSTGVLFDVLATADFSSFNEFVDLFGELSEAIAPVVFGLTQIAFLADDTARFLEGVQDFDTADDAIKSYIVSVGEATLDTIAFAEGVEDAKNEIIDFANETNEATQAELDYADAILATRFALRERDDILEGINERREEIAEEQAELERESISQRLQLERQLANSLRELDIDTANRRRDAIEKTNQQRKDATTKLTRELSDLETKFSRDEEDAFLKKARKLEDITDKENQKRLDSLDEFERKKRDIRNKFDQDALEAILANDAVRLREIRRREQDELQDLETSRQDEDADIGRDFGRQRKAVQLQLERDLEDAETALERRGEDLNLAYDRQLEDLQTSLSREFASITQGEKDKTDELNRQHKFRLEEQRIQNAETLALLQEGLDEQFEALRQHQLKVNKLLTDQARARLLLDLENFVVPEEAQARFGRATRRLDTTDPLTNPRRGSIPQGIDVLGFRQYGGSVLAGQSFIVGESGPELVKFPANATIEPNLSSLRLPPLTGSATSVDNSRNISADIALGQLEGLTPVQRAETINMITDILQRAIR